MWHAFTVKKISQGRGWGNGGGKATAVMPHGGGGGGGGLSLIGALVKHYLSLTSDSKLPDTGYLRTKGQESVYETCACVIHTILLSYMCINIVSHSQ